MVDLRENPEEHAAYRHVKQGERPCLVSALAGLGQAPSRRVEDEQVVQDEVGERPGQTVPPNVGEGHNPVQGPEAEELEGDPDGLAEDDHRVLGEHVEPELLERVMGPAGLPGVRPRQNEVVEVGVVVEVVGEGVVREGMLMVPEEGRGDQGDAEAAEPVDPGPMGAREVRAVVAHRAKEPGGEREDKQGRPVPLEEAAVGDEDGQEHQQVVGPSLPGGDHVHARHRRRHPPLQRLVEHVLTPPLSPRPAPQAVRVQHGLLHGHAVLR